MSDALCQIRSQVFFRSAALILVSVLACAVPLTGAVSPRFIQFFDEHWRFLKADANGAETPGFDDSTWRILDVPHDWSIEGPFDQNNPAGGAGAFLPTGVGWYRKAFTLPPDSNHRRVFIDFDGVMANSDVWINGFHLGHRPYGYVSFRYELTDHLNFDQPNIIAVRADNSAQPASRWYAGAGIYRHVRLVITDPIHIEHWGTVVITPQITAQRATVHLKTTVVNQSSSDQRVAVTFVVQGPGKIAEANHKTYRPIAAGQSAIFEQDLIVNQPSLWELDHPNLYKATATVWAESKQLDKDSVPFGIREFHFDPANGFWLNGKNFKIKGVCLHPEVGGLGTAVPLEAWARRLRELRALGVNAIRTSHNPFAPEILDLCDRMGFLVKMFDCWTVAKNPYDYHLYFEEWSLIDTRDTVQRDRNHPSIILYSAGNEIHDTPKADLAKRILGSLLTTFHENDPTRPVTQALFRPNVSHDYEDGLADMLDVVGQNYRENEILAAHAAKPSRKIVGTENGHDLKVWLALRDNPPYSGQFIWSGVDYLGESRRWPMVGDSAGLLERTGRPRARALQRQSWWSEMPNVHIVRRTGITTPTPIDPGYENVPARERQTLFADWTPADLAKHDETVDLYSNCEQVELVLNGKSLGFQPIHQDDSPRSFVVPFEPGTLQAVGKNGGKIVATDELRTAGKPAKIALSADKPVLANDWDDVDYLTATVVDENGIVVPTANDEIAFDVSGPARIAAVDNGDNISHEPFQASQRRAFQGLCIAVLKATAPSGSVTVRASTSGLASASVTLRLIPSIAN